MDSNKEYREKAQLREKLQETEEKLHLAESKLKHAEETLMKRKYEDFAKQMQPHFLYNTLQSIEEMILINPEEASSLLEDFTYCLRGIIRAMSNRARIPFTEELQNIKAYVNIWRMRIGDRLKVVYDIRAMDFEIVPFSIQSLIENAIKHGIYNKNGSGCIRLSSKDEKEAFVIRVEDDGDGFDYEQMKLEIESGVRDSSGLQNLIYRLNLEMNATVDINSEQGKGTWVTVWIPKV